ncbi:hypothetical protein OA39_02924 [Vibrio campbellii]|nr:hypothetical protein OA39_02924 [Vibrio campbellii]
MLTTMKNRIIAISYKNLSRMTSAFYLLLSAPRVEFDCLGYKFTYK